MLDFHILTIFVNIHNERADYLSLGVISLKFAAMELITDLSKNSRILTFHYRVFRNQSDKFIPPSN